MSIPSNRVHDTLHTSSAALSVHMSAASTDARRFFGPQQAPAWKPRARRQTRWWLLGVLALAAGGVAATVWHRQPSQVPPAAEPRPATHPALLLDLPGTPAAPTTINELAAPVSLATPMAASPPAQEPPLLERLDNAELRIRLVAHDRHAAANRLAALTGARLLERPDALAQTRPVTLRWQGHDAAGAWRALLADEAHYLLDCRVERACKVWIFGAHRASAVGASAVQPAAATATASSPDLPAEVETPAAAPAPVLQSDPPGLFPSD